MTCIETDNTLQCLSKVWSAGPVEREFISVSKTRKKISDKEEARLKTTRAKFSSNVHIKNRIGSGEDLIAKGSEYHRSCRVQLLIETEHEEKPNDGSTPYNKRAFASLLFYVKNEVLTERRSVLASDLLSMYKVEYTSLGGDGADIKAYTAPNLTRMLKEHLKKEVSQKIADQRKGNFICSSGVPEEDAKVRLYGLLAIPDYDVSEDRDTQSHYIPKF